MPRAARLKVTNGIYHVMVKSISDVDLFRDDADKVKYISFLEKYKAKFNFKIYGFCLMDNHGHIIIATNEESDISSIMHCVNVCYAMYYNRKYQREGHLFRDRFKSKLVKSDRYLIVLSLYIHNNPKDIPGFNTHIDKYPFSSLRAYLSPKKDLYKITDSGLVLSYFSENISKAIKKYVELLNAYSNGRIACEININKPDEDIDESFKLSDYLV